MNRTISATEFRAKCFWILDHVEPSGLVITKRGRPVARVTPVQPIDDSKLSGSMKGKIKILGDIFSTGVKWDPQS